MYWKKWEAIRTFSFFHFLLETLTPLLSPETVFSTCNCKIFHEVKRFAKPTNSILQVSSWSLIKCIRVFCPKKNKNNTGFCSRRIIVASSKTRSTITNTKILCPKIFIQSIKCHRIPSGNTRKYENTRLISCSTLYLSFVKN